MLAYSAALAHTADLKRQKEATDLSIVVFIKREEECK